MKTAFADKSGLITRKAEDSSALIIVDDSGEKLEVPVNDKDDIISCIDEYKVGAFVCLTVGIDLMIELARKDVEIIGGARGRTEDVVTAYLSGTLETDDFALDCGSGNCNGDCSRCH